MSGPKRARIHVSPPAIPYDPTPERVADLRKYTAKLEHCLTCRQGVLAKHLGTEAVEEVRAAYEAVLECIEEELPDEGFDAYGQAWETLNSLWREAKAKREEDRRLARAAARRKQQIRQKALVEERRRAAQVKERARETLGEFRAMWTSADARRLLDRWAAKEEARGLARALTELTECAPHEVIERAPSWQERFDQCIHAAESRAEANAQEVAELMPAVSASLSALAELDLSSLEADERAFMEYQTSRVHAQVDTGFGEENVAALREAIGEAEGLRSGLAAEIERTQTERAAEAWVGALRELGYSVEARPADESGMVVIQASGFPTRSLLAAFQPGSEEVALHVNGEHDSTQCVRDIESIQQVLAKRGVEFEMTDWGRANPTGQALQTQAVQQRVGG